MGDPLCNPSAHSVFAEGGLCQTVGLAARHMQATAHLWVLHSSLGVAPCVRT